MASKIETLRAPLAVRSGVRVVGPGVKVLRAVGDWFRDGQLGASYEKEMSRATGSRI